MNSQEELVLSVLGAEAAGEGVVERACRTAARAAVAAEAGALRARIEATAAALSGRGGAAQGGGAALHAARAAGGGASGAGAGTGIAPLGGALGAASAGSLPLLSAAAGGQAAAPNGGGLPLSNPDASAGARREFGEEPMDVGEDDARATSGPEAGTSAGGQWGGGAVCGGVDRSSFLGQRPSASFRPLSGQHLTSCASTCFSLSRISGLRPCRAYHPLIPYGRS